jgi:methylenetetrahydrofolate reductase (NADPH)
LNEKLEGARSDDAAKRIGMDFSIDLGLQLLKGGAPGLHIFTLNQHLAALELARGVGLA